jgi:hypothetical protein
MQALGFEIRRDGEASLVIIRNGAVAGWIERSRRDRTAWRAVTVSGELKKCHSVSAAVDHIVSLTR